MEPPRPVTSSSNTIDEETDRLNGLVGNLLDMSRIQTGALELTSAPVGLEEVLPAAVHSLGLADAAVDLDVPEHASARRRRSRGCSSGRSPTSSRTPSAYSPAGRRCE